MLEHPARTLEPAPLAGLQIAQMVLPHCHPHQPQGGQANGGGHAPHLAASEAALESRHLQTQVVLESARREALKAQSDAGLAEMAQASPPKDEDERAQQALVARILRGESTYQTNTTL